ncbi:DUF5906 domain-containing protein [Methylobacterium sp. NEAU 140]|uniref:TOTE conflict system archaeo-eukaryotic primase domain-containing protein n=1 Tax=Methylobacterium sp. NEAU 140 TaxID=3064945 RepID=UPI0027373C90|nr:DUF5906 domain-containing protein [Methylobacterium sp. NEAU 140]MDP4027009.1 DUF5906 domain-containing protein [Methylobacterium sp. NEAU 140]
MSALPAPAPSLAQLLLDRFGGRRSVYAKRKFLTADDRWGYVPARRKSGDSKTDIPLTLDVVERHLANKAETDAIGVYLVPEGEHRVTFAVLDIDNHGGALPWLEVAEKVRPIVTALNRLGQVLAVRSGGGSGIHLVLFFAQPEEAAKVRSFLHFVLGSCGLKDGPSGIGTGAVEVFPRQDNVKAGDYGNLIGLPFARKSVPLDDDLQPLSVDAALDRLAIIPDFELPETRGEGRRRSAASDDAGDEESPPAGNVVDFAAAKRSRLDPAAENGVGEGGRDETCWKLASKWCGEGIPIEEAEIKMDVFCDGCTPPYERAEGRKKLHRAYEKYELGDSKRAREAAAVEEMNKKFALVLQGGSSLILRDRPGSVPDFIKLGAFKDYHANAFVGKRNKAQLWMSHPDRRTYEDVAFSPGRDTPGTYNLWRGFVFEPSESGTCNLFLEHLRENVAQGDPELFRWVEAWLAQIIQRPAVKLGTSLVLRGAQGTGKTKVGEVIGKLLGPHYVLADDSRLVVGQFNAHLARAILLHADEAFFAGDRSSVGKLRSLITSSKTTLEKKNVDPVEVANYMRLLVTSDKGWVVPAALEERRFAVLDMSERHRQDTAYFKALDAELEAGGYGALMKHFLSVDIDAVDLRTIPKTKALEDQKIHSMEPVPLFWFTRLFNGEIKTDDSDWSIVIAKSELYQQYLIECRDTNERYRMNSAQFGRELRKICPDIKDTKTWLKFKLPDGAEDEKQVHAYGLPNLAKCRAAFDAATGCRTDWPEIDEGSF